MSQVGLLRREPNLKALYHLENVYDESGNDKHLTTGSGSFVVGLFGYGLQCNGSSYRSRLDDVIGMNLAGDITIIEWFRFAATPSGAGISLGNGNYNHVLWFNSGTLQYTSCGALTTMNPAFVIGRKYLCGITCTSAGAMSLFLNGCKVATGTRGEEQASTYGLEIGCYGGTAYMSNSIADEIGIWQEVKTEQWMRRYYAWATGKL